MKKTSTCLSIFLMSLFPFVVLAQESNSPYLATMSMFDTISSIIFALCHIAGMIFFFMSMIYFRRYRQNPNETPISRVLWVLVLGLIIFFLPWVAEQNSIYQEMQNADQRVTQTQYAGS